MCYLILHVRQSLLQCSGINNRSFRSGFRILIAILLLSKFRMLFTGELLLNFAYGIYNDSEMSLRDAPSIFSNGDHDIYTSKGKVIEIAGELTFTNKITVKTTGTNTVITSGYSLYSSKKPSTYFKSADSSSVLRMTSAENGEVMLRNDAASTTVEVYKNQKLVKSEEFTDPAAAWEKALTLAGDNELVKGVTAEDSVVEITLGTDWVSDKCLYTGEKKNIVIDLNGHCVRRSGKKQKDGGVFRIGERSKLTVNDSNPASKGYANHSGGVIADGNGDDCGGGIIIETSGQLFMTGGTIYNCVTDEHGGGIYARGEKTVVSLKDCAIDSCKTKNSGDDAHGGGIYVKNAISVTLENVTVKNCESEDKGGGMYLCDKPGIVRLKNTVFENNFSNDGGGAIFIDDLSSDKEFDFVAEDCTFKKNSTKDRGGAVYVNDNDESKSNNPTVFTDCVFEENESTKNGSAIEANDNGVVLCGGTITKNKTSAKGAVYVEDEYDITVSGLLVIKDNSGKSGNQNLVLEKESTKAYIYNAGLSEGSEIYISSSGGGTGYPGVKDVSKYQSKYFHAESGKLNFKKTGTKEAEMAVTASLFGEGSRTVIFILAGAALIITGAAVLFAKKRKGAANDDDEE